MKTPITYYGGKQRMTKLLLGMIPEHRLYCEPFFGGGALFFAKEPSPVEVINDLDDRAVNFYRVMQQDFDSLFSEIHSTLHSRSQHTHAKYILTDKKEEAGESYSYAYQPEVPDNVREAWAFWVQTNMSFSGKMLGGFAYCRGGSTTKSIRNKIESFTMKLKTRLDYTCIECNDALKVITSRDTDESFFYCDPPYFNSDCGHYKGYSESDYRGLLETLSNIKGKFLLSSYPSAVLDEFVEKNGWYQKEKDMAVSVSSKAGKRKTEVLTYNYLWF